MNNEIKKEEVKNFVIPESFDESFSERIFIYYIDEASTYPFFIKIKKGQAIPIFS